MEYISVLSHVLYPCCLCYILGACAISLPLVLYPVPLVQYACCLCCILATCSVCLLLVQYPCSFCCILAACAVSFLFVLYPCCMCCILAACTVSLLLVLYSSFPSAHCLAIPVTPRPPIFLLQCSGTICRRRSISASLTELLSFFVRKIFFSLCPVGDVRMYV